MMGCCLQEIFFYFLLLGRVSYSSGVSTSDPVDSTSDFTGTPYTGVSESERIDYRSVPVTDTTSDVQTFQSVTSSDVTGDLATSRVDTRSTEQVTDGGQTDYETTAQTTADSSGKKDKKSSDNIDVYLIVSVSIAGVIGLLIVAACVIVAVKNKRIRNSGLRRRYSDDRHPNILSEDRLRSSRRHIGSPAPVGFQNPLVTDGAPVVPYPSYMPTSGGDVTPVYRDPVSHTAPVFYDEEEEEKTSHDAFKYHPSSLFRHQEAQQLDPIPMSAYSRSLPQLSPATGEGVTYFYNGQFPVYTSSQHLPQPYKYV